jgi:hypothetical protein
MASPGVLSPEAESRFKQQLAQSERIYYLTGKLDNLSLDKGSYERIQVFPRQASSTRFEMSPRRGATKK